MRRVFSVSVVLLFLGLLIPHALEAQGNQGRGSRVKGNYPNPFNPTTTIAFTLWDEDLVGGRPAVVSIRIYNALKQLVATPKALNYGSGALVEGLAYATAGDKQAYWDGTDKSGTKVASGIYYYVLVVNGRPEPARRMIVTK